MTEESTEKKVEKSPQISEDEFEFYLKNRLKLAEIEKTMAVNYGKFGEALTKIVGL